MIGRIHFKRALKSAAGRISVANTWLARPRPTAHGCVLVYHRVADVGFIDPRLDDWNVAPGTFERHIAALCDMGQIIPLLDLPEKLRPGLLPDRAWICLTFDDGFANFYKNVLPILIRFSAPAILFMPTSAIGGTEPMPFDRWAMKNRSQLSDDAWRPLNWDELERCLDSGLVSVGSHSHHHRNGRDCRPDELQEEAERSREILAARLGGDNIHCYAYPYGNSRLGQVTPAYVDAVRRAGYSLAVSTDLGLAGSDSDLLLLPRIEAHPLDTPAVLRAKAQGFLAPYYLTDRMRRARRS